MVEIEVRAVLRHQRRLGEAGAVVFGGEARDVERRLDGIAQRLCRKVRGAGVTLALAGIDGDADTLVAVVLDGFDFVATHRHRLAEALRNIDLARARPLAGSVFEDIGGKLLEGGEGIGEGGGFGHGRGVKTGKSLS